MHALPAFCSLVKTLNIIEKTQLSEDLNAVTGDMSQQSKAAALLVGSLAVLTPPQAGAAD